MQQFSAVSVSLKSKIWTFEVLGFVKKILKPSFLNKFVQTSLQHDVCIFETFKKVSKIDIVYKRTFGCFVTTR